jgi:hypothetical protein
MIKALLLLEALLAILAVLVYAQTEGDKSRDGELEEEEDFLEYLDSSVKVEEGTSHKDTNSAIHVVLSHAQSERDKPMNRELKEEDEEDEEDELSDYDDSTAAVEEKASSEDTSSRLPPIPIERCRSFYTRFRAICDLVRIRCLLDHGIIMKWAGVGSRPFFFRDGGCQCNQFCGYFTRRPCNRDSQCYWDRFERACFNRRTGEIGEPIEECPVFSARRPTTSPTTSSPTLSPTPPTFRPTRSPLTPRPSRSPRTARPSRSPRTSRPSRSPRTPRPSRSPR